MAESLAHRGTIFSPILPHKRALTKAELLARFWYGHRPVENGKRVKLRSYEVLNGFARLKSTMLRNLGKARHLILHAR
jgi:hypothetical protein